MNRIIRSGKYYVDDIPVNKADFRLYPHFPRTSKYVSDLITDSCNALITADEWTRHIISELMNPLDIFQTPVYKFEKQKTNNM